MMIGESAYSTPTVAAAMLCDKEPAIIGLETSIRKLRREAPGFFMRREEVTVLIRRIAGNEDLPLPRYHTAQAVAMDLHAAVKESIRLPPGDILLVPCGFSLAVPAGFEAQIRPRSGLASKSGIAVVNSPGTIDSDYRGEVKVALINLGKAAFSVERGMRIAQLLIFPVPRVHWEELAELPDTTRGEGGFGHTGE